MYDFKTFAQMNLDLIFKGFDRLPQPGEEVFAKSFTLQLGGRAHRLPHRAGAAGLPRPTGDLHGEGRRQQHLPPTAGGAELLQLRRVRHPQSGPGGCDQRLLLGP